MTWIDGLDREKARERVKSNIRLSEGVKLRQKARRTEIGEMGG